MMEACRKRFITGKMRLLTASALLATALSARGAAPGLDSASGSAWHVSSAPTLYEQSAARVWRESVSTSIDYLLLDVGSSALVDARWPNNSEPASLGSLIKPFTAVAYARTFAGRYPEFVCAGQDTCWLPGGHGRLDLPHAVAFSCNAYFARLAPAVSREAWDDTLREFALPRQNESPRPDKLTGIDAQPWVSPLEMARAYCALVSASQPGVREVLQGMTLSAELGTGRAVNRAIFPEKALVKTGTASCVHTPRGSGDGYAIVLWPSEAPRCALLVRLHNGPGARAAAAAGEMIRIVMKGR